MHRCRKWRRDSRDTVAISRLPAPPWPRCCAMPGGARSGWARITNVPVDSWHMGASRKEWPMAQGYDRFDGFLGGETNQWFPDLVEDNHYVDQPHSPEDGYHLSKDLADKALQFIRDSKQSAPDSVTSFPPFTCITIEPSST